MTTNDGDMWAMFAGAAALGDEDHRSEPDGHNEV